MVKLIEIYEYDYIRKENHKESMWINPEMIRAIRMYSSDGIIYHEHFILYCEYGNILINKETLNKILKVTKNDNNKRNNS